MQIIEVTRLAGVRVNVVTLTSSGASLKFVLFPMIHLAEQSFYDSVVARLRECDLVVAEGVGPGSAVGAAVMLAYRLNARFGRSRLVLQTLHLGELGVPVINPDATGAEFEASWRTTPLWLRLVASALFPFILIWSLAFGTRGLIASQLPLDDLPSRDKLLLSNSVTQNIDRVLLDERDRRLCDQLMEIQRTHRAEAIQVAVVYGAGHLPAVTEFLNQP